MMDSSFQQGQAAAARANFPSGLIQPQGSYRFGADALLLAAFAASRHFSRRLLAKGNRAIDLGCGIGPAIFAFALQKHAWQYFGIDREEQLLAAARANAKQLGLPVNFLQGDLTAWRSPVLERSFQLVMANPPWREEDRGRASPAFLREQALGNAPQDFFCQAASQLLVWHGLFCCIIPPGRLCEFALALQANRLGLRQLFPLASRQGKKATRLLCLAQKDARAEPELLPTLVLHQDNGQWREEALRFCEYLRK